MRTPVSPARLVVRRAKDRPVTSVLGHLSAKQTSTNPNFAAVLVEMLKEAGVQQGDVVAVGVSGSFPALNICTYAALESLGARPLVISSASASQWGANVPQLMWPDMEHLLLRQKRVDEEGKELPPVFSIKSIATSIGGNNDEGEGLTEEEIKKLLLDAFSANPQRYGQVSTIEGGTVTTTTNVRVALNWNRLSLQQTGKDTERIDWLYKIHYLQWTGVKWLDRILGMLGLALIVILSVLGLMLQRGGLSRKKL